MAQRLRHRLQVLWRQVRSGEILSVEEKRLAFGLGERVG